MGAAKQSRLADVLRRWSVAIAVALMLAPWPIVAADDIRIDAVLPLSGPMSGLGAPAAAALKAEVDALNAAGGIDGTKLVLSIADDLGQPARARNLMAAARAQRAVAVIGGVTAATALAMVQEAEASGISLFALSAAHAITEPLRPFIFAIVPSDVAMCTAMLRDITAHKLGRIALAASSDGLGKQQAAACRTAARALGITFVADVVVPAADKSYVSEVAQARLAGADAMIGVGVELAMVTLVRSVRKLAWTAPLYVGPGAASDIFVDRARGAADGIRIVAPAGLLAGRLAGSDPQHGVVTRFDERFRAAASTPVTLSAIAARDALAVVVAAIRRSGAGAGRDPGVLRDEIERTTGLVGAGGAITLGPADHRGLDLNAFRVVTIKDGVPSPVQ
jgi:branched-chain amino acid transport system substrate-binding protein